MLLLTAMTEKDRAERERYTSGWVPKPQGMHLEVVKVVELVEQVEVLCGERSLSNTTLLKKSLGTFC